ncbi:MAG: DUF6526 family protein [Bacteroidota bacterium]|nr:DUF6526 family protein [Bacteroidota bacterium]
MAKQNYHNHRRYQPLFHFVLYPLMAATFIGSIVNLNESWNDRDRFYSASLLVAVCIILPIIILLMRHFALRVQDRVIRAEENLRHFVLTGKVLDPRIKKKQIIALRFASDDEFVRLSEHAANEGMVPGEIKQSIKQWRVDSDRI